MVGAITEDNSFTEYVPVKKKRKSSATKVKNNPAAEQDEKEE